MKTKVIKASIKNDPCVIYQMTNFMEHSGIRYSLSIPGHIQNRLFTIQLSASPLPVHAKVEITVEHRYFHKTVKKEISLSSEAPTQKLFFGICREYFYSTEFTITIKLETIKNTQTILPETKLATSIQNSYPNVISHDDPKLTKSTTPTDTKSSSNDINPFKKGIDDDPELPTIKPENSETTNHSYNGIRNLGTTCYLNSIVQTLFLLSQFRQLIYDAPVDQIKDKENSVLFNLKRLFYHLQTSQYPCDSTQFCLAFTKPNFHVNRHQDAHEFLKLLLSSIEKEQSSLKNSIQSLFQGKILVNTLEKHSHSILSQISEDISDISIDLYKTLDKSLKSFNDVFELEDNSGHLTQSFLSELPKVLIIHLKRYEADPEIPSHIIKKNDSLSYNDTIDIKGIMSKDKLNQETKFRLFSIVAHTGFIEAGHYKMFCQPEMDDNWYEFNDSSVTKCTKYQAIQGNYGFPNDMTAYLLFYVRLDSINEVFSKTNPVKPSPQVVTAISSYVPPEKSFTQSKQNYQYIKFISTIDSFRWNCINGIPGFLNNAKSLKVDLTDDLTNKDLYQQIARQLNTKVQCIRLWSCKNKTTFDEVIKNDLTRCDKLKPIDIFVQIKSEKEPLLLDKKQCVYFIKVYTPGLQTPFLSLDIREIRIESYSNSISETTIMNDIKPFLPSSIYSCDLYIENRLKLNKIIYFETISNGSVLIIHAKRFYFSQNDISRTMSKLGVQYDLDLYKNNDQLPSYYDLMDPEIPEEIEKYFKQKANLKKVPLFNYQDIETKLFDIDFPSTINYEDLKNYITQIIHPDHNQTLILFSNSTSQVNLPNTYALSSHGQSITIERIFYLLIDKNDKNGWSKTRIVHFSKDGRTVHKKLAFYLSDSATFNEILEMCDTSLIRKTDDIRLYLIDNKGTLSDIITNYNEDIKKIDYNHILRIDIIPFDQRGADVKLMKVYPTIKSYISYQIYDSGFYMKYIQNETLKELERRLLNYTNATDFNTKLTFFDSFPKYNSIPIKNLDRLDDKKDLFVVYDFGEELD